MRRLFIICIIVLFFLMTGCGRKEIDVMEGVNVKVTGINGEGTACITGTYGWLDQIEEEMEEEHNIKKGNLARASILKNMVKYTLEPSSGLYNGDEIILRVDYDNQAAAKYGYYFTGTGRTVYISGLKMQESIDLFEDIEVLFDGTAPEGVAHLDQNFKIFHTIPVTYDIVPDTGLRNGDIVTVNAKTDVDAMKHEGFTPESVQKTFLVNGLNKYLTSSAELDMGIKEKVYTEGESLIRRLLLPGEKNESNLKYCNLTERACKNDGNTELYQTYQDAEMAALNPSLFLNHEPLEFEKDPTICPVHLYIFTAGESMMTDNSDERHKLILVYEMKISDNVVGEASIYVPVEISGLQMDNTGAILEDSLNMKILENYGFSWERIYQELIIQEKNGWSVENVNISIVN